MEVAVSDVWSVEIPIAVETVEEKCKAVNLVKDLLPTHVLCFPQVKKELLHVERSVNHMLYNQLTFKVNENSILVCLRAHQVLLLVHRKQGVAVEASLKQVAFILSQNLQFEHVDPAQDSVSPIHDLVELLQ